MSGDLGRLESRRTLVVVAHPDDETFGTGSLLLHLAAAGTTTGVCCASRGEAGDVCPGATVPHGGIAELREAELREAATLLGVDEVFLLDLLDSGLIGPAPTGSVVSVRFTDVVDRVSATIDTFRPDLIATLDGSDGHRDHARIRDAAVAAGREHGIPVWLHCLPQHLMQRWAEHLARDTPDSPYLDLAELGTPDDLHTMHIDTAEHYARRQAAIAAHRSQTSPFEALPEELRREFLTTEHLRHAGPGDPDRARHRHGRDTCFWDQVECRWSCQLSSTAHQPTAAV